MKKKLVAMAIVAVMLIPSVILLNKETVKAENEWIIDGDTVYVDDELVYASATPHTIAGSDTVVFEFESKEYTGNVDFAWGFNETVIKPTAVDLWQNYSHPSYSYETVEQYGCVTLENVITFSNLGIENYSEYDVTLGNENNTYLYEVTYNETNETTEIYAFSEYSNTGSDYTLCGNYDNEQKVWNNQTYFDWKQWDVDIDHINWNYQNTTDWYVTPSQGIVQDVRYKVRVHLQQQKISLEQQKGKYWFAFKPSDETLQEALDNDHLYYLDPWYNSNWEYRKEITIDHNQVASDLSNFPICINITDTDLRDKAQADGDDILFTNETGTQLNHEIELYNSTTGQLVSWVNVTDLSSTSNTTLYMYYNNSGASNQENVGDVWDSNYLSVHHFVGETYTDIDDSTNNNNDIVNWGGTPEYNQEGYFGYATIFNGFNEFLETAQTFSWGKVTLEAVFNVASFPASGSMTILENYDPSSGEHTGLRVWNDNKINFFVDDDVYAYWHEKNSQVMAGDTKYYGAGTFDHTVDTIHIYLNNYPRYTNTNVLTGVMDADEPFYFGSKEGSEQYFDGMLDEIRISDIARSQAWINTTYHSFFNATDGGFFTLGSEETDIDLTQFKPIINVTDPINGSEIIYHNFETFDFNVNISNFTGIATVKLDTYSNDVTRFPKMFGGYDDIYTYPVSMTSNTSVSVTPDWTTELSYGQNITYWINVTHNFDGNSSYTNETFYFTTAENHAPNITDETPSDEAINVDIDTNLSINISDDNGDTMTYNITLYKNSSQLSIIDAYDYSENSIETTRTNIFVENENIIVAGSDGLYLFKMNDQFIELVDKYNETYYDETEEQQKTTNYTAVWADENYIYTGTNTKIYDIGDYANFQVFSINETTETLEKEWEYRGNDTGDNYQYGTAYGTFGDTNYVYLAKNYELVAFDLFDGTDCDFHRVRNTYFNISTWPLSVWANETYTFTGVYTSWNYGVRAFSNGINAILNRTKTGQDQYVYGNDDYIFTTAYSNSRVKIYSFDGSQFNELDRRLFGTDFSKGIYAESTNYFGVAGGGSGISIGKFDNNEIIPITVFDDGNKWYAVEKTGSYWLGQTETQELYAFELNEGTREVVGYWNGTSGNGTVEIDPGTLDPGTYYEWEVNISDGSVSTDENYSFFTEINNVPQISNPQPAEGTTDISHMQNVSVDISDVEGDEMEIYFYTNVSGTFELIGSNTTAEDGTYSFNHTFEPATKCYWFVNVTDGNSWNNQTFYFTTNIFIDFNYTIVNQTVYFYDNSSTLDTLEYWTWDFGDGAIAHGSYDEHKNPVHTYHYNWQDIVLENISINVTMQVCYADFTNCTQVTKQIIIDNPALPSDEADLLINIPVDLIIVLFSLIAILALFKILMDTINTIGKRRNKK